MKLVAAYDPVIWSPAAPMTAEDVANHGETFKKLPDVMHSLNASCLTFPQVGIALAAFVTKFPPFELAINPQWLPKADCDYVTRIECCVSNLNRQVFVRRASKIAASWDDLNGARQGKTLEGSEARVFQHLCDSLQGYQIFQRPTTPQHALT